MTDTISMEALDGDQEDPSGLNKASILALVKAVLYHGSTADELLAELVATILLYVPYNAEFHTLLYQVMDADASLRTELCSKRANLSVQILTRKIEDWRTWLLCHQKVWQNADK